SANAVLALRRHPARVADGLERTVSERAATIDLVIHRDEPLRRVAEDHRLLRPPGMRIVVAQAASGDERVRVDESLYHSLVGVAEIALVVDDPFPLEAWRFFGEVTVGIDGERNSRIYFAIRKQPLIRGPDLAILRTMARCRVHKASASVVCDMLAGEQRHLEIVTLAAQRMRRHRVP